MLEFCRTPMGRTFFDGTLPRIAKALAEIARKLPEPEPASQRTPCGPQDASARMAEAVRARIQGEFDRPALMEIGPLSADTDADILAILDHYTKEGN
jgi:hypothetical protein